MKNLEVTSIEVQSIVRRSKGSSKSDRRLFDCWFFVVKQRLDS